MRLQQDFFIGKSVLILARDLLGKVFVYQSEQGVLSGIISETEAYSEDEPACHAYQGRQTARNRIMFSAAGHLYVYFTYGMYYCVNIVADPKGKAEAVLLRALIPWQGKHIMLINRQGRSKQLANGPAKLAMALGLDKRHNGLNLLAPDSPVFLEDHGFTATDIEQTPRIGISKATELPWRFIMRSYQ